MPKYAVIIIKSFKYALTVQICHYILHNFCKNTPLIENPSDFDASFDWSHLEQNML